MKKTIEWVMTPQKCSWLLENLFMCNVFYFPYIYISKVDHRYIKHLKIPYIFSGMSHLIINSY